MERHERDVSDGLHHLGELIGALSVTIDTDLTQTSLSHKRKELARVT